MSISKERLPSVSIEEPTLTEGELDGIPTSAMHPDGPPSPSRADTKFFKKKQLFVEMDEFRESFVRDPRTHKFERTQLWVETHRWNFGLQEDLDEQGHTVWNHPHLPWCSVVGLVDLRDHMSEDMVFLDVPSETFGEAIQNIVEKLTENEVLDANASRELTKVLHLHSARHRGFSEGDDLNSSSSSFSRVKPTLNVSAKPRQNRSGVTHDDDDFALGRAHVMAKDEEEFNLLLPGESEEAADILVGNFPWLKEPVVAFIRLKGTLDIRLERHAQAKFLVLVIGPVGDEEHAQHVQLGEAAAALLQDEVIVEAAYTSQSPGDFLDVVDYRMNKMTVVPHVHRPTDKGMVKAKRKLRKQLEALAEVKPQQVWVGGEWDELAAPVFRTGYSMSNFVKFLEKYALMLLMGIVLGLAIKNVDPDWYRNFEADHGDDLYVASIIPSTNINTTNTSTTASSSHDDDDAHDSDHFEVPTFFGLVLHGHRITLHFIANEIFMSFHFGLATAEIVESFLPGAILYPPTKKAVNPLIATLGGVIGPVLLFFVFCGIFDAAGVFTDYSLEEVLVGWAIPTATDIPLAWAVALLVFGRGHPAINYLLLLAVVDDGLGMIIIAAFYSDNFDAVYLLIVIIGMATAFIMRKANVMDWRPYIFIAGPICWYGLLQSGLHSALSICFVVPFMPTSIPMRTGCGGEPTTAKEETLTESSSDSDDDSDAGLPDVHDPTYRAKIPLFQFSHSIKYFVDFLILPLFGLVNAGVDCTVIGPFSGVIYLSATLGKTAGIALFSLLASRFGFHPPPGVDGLKLVMVSFIASIGLTVALFVAGAAYPGAGINVYIQAEAKLGVLLAFANGIVAIAVGKMFNMDAPFGLRDAVSIQHKDFDGKGSDNEHDESTSGSDDDHADSSDDDEFLEHVMAIEYVDQLRKMHDHLREVEAETKVTRKRHLKTMRERLRELEQERHREEDIYVRRSSHFNVSRLNSRDRPSFSQVKQVDESLGLLSVV
eukprot:m.164155 g.164155  ORF g.164155 m.164155 type:complete len:995 (+) comp31325_c0_seq1:73-3057(+)